mmetsp:Transcript_7/g.16  ORF Transcript_7/g.16 Transcript_7/m.16 type:complete len:275 (+) Transcript_7:453-1277(+)
MRPGLNNSLLVTGRSSSLLRTDKSSSNPNSLATEREGHSEATAIVDTTCSNNKEIVTGQWALLSFAHINNHGPENSGSNLSSVSSSLASLCTNNVNICSNTFGDMLGRTNHVHHRNSSGMQFINSPAGRNTNSTHKQTSLFFNDNINQLWECSLSVIKVGFSGRTANLGKKEINTKSTVRVFQSLFENSDLFSKKLWCVANTTNNTKTSSIGHSSSQLRSSGNIHTSKNDGMSNTKHFGKLGGEGALWLRGRHLAWLWLFPMKCETKKRSVTEP